MLTTRFAGSPFLSFCLRRRNDKLGHPDTMRLGPGHLLGIREAATLLSALLGGLASAGAVLAGKRRRIVFFYPARLRMEMKRKEHPHHGEQQQIRCTAPG